MNKALYYVNHALMTLIPPVLIRWHGKRVLSSLSSEERKNVKLRVDYYNKLNKPFKLTAQKAVSVGNFTKTGGTTYYYDLYKVVKHFSPEYQFQYICGDVVTVPTDPSFLKSRPIGGNNQNSVLLKLNAIRHYQFINDTLEFRAKKDFLVWRGAGFRANRRLLLDLFFDHPRCNVGRTDKEDQQNGHTVARLSIEEQLQYKFILSLEGKDVATNLKWIMSSNSLCITPKLRYETWFMEGRLEAGVHYVEIKDDFSDLIEKMDYYLANPQEAEEIIKNAQAWVEQFLDPKQEKLISLLVAKKYFKLSDQSSV